MTSLLRRTSSSQHPTNIAFFLLAVFALTCTARVSAQTVTVQNGTTLQVQNGAVFDLESGEMDLGGSGTTNRLAESSAGRVTGGTLTATRSLNGPSAADPAGLGAILTSGANLGAVTITRGHAAQTASNGNASIERYYDISPAQNNGGLDATLALTYHDAERNGISEADLELFRSTDGGSSWTQEGVDSRTTAPTGGNTVRLSEIAEFSRWTLGGASSPLPVELVDFAGKRSGEDVHLSWRTTSETNNAGFRIQRQTDHTGIWREVGFVDSRAPGGTTTEAQTYRFEDTDFPFAADSMAYRLQQVDFDGTKTLSDPLVIDRSSIDEPKLLGTYPNPAQTHATVRYAVPERAESARLDLFDLLGRRVASVATGLDAGRHKRTLSVSDLSSGVYFIRLRTESSVKTTKLTVVR